MLQSLLSNGVKLFTGAILAICPTSQQTPAATTEDSILKIRARQCQFGDERALTGFVSREHGGIVTALHGVVECAEIWAEGNASLGPFRELEVSQVDIASDIAVLTSQQLSEFVAGNPETGLRTATDAAESLRIVGFPYDIDAQWRTEDVNISAEKKLRSLIPPRHWSAFDNCRSPSLNGIAFGIDGVLRPGESGAPLLNQNGEVVAVGIGGIDGGRVAMVWAVPLSGIRLIKKGQLQAELSDLASESCPTALFSSTNEADFVGRELTDRLIEAARSGRNKRVRELVALGASVNRENDSGSSPLGSALEFEHVSTAILLLDLGADPSVPYIRSERNRSQFPIDAAIDLDSFELCQRLISLSNPAYSREDIIAFLEKTRYTGITSCAQVFLNHETLPVSDRLTFGIQVLERTSNTRRSGPSPKGLWDIAKMVAALSEPPYSQIRESVRDDHGSANQLLLAALGDIGYEILAEFLHSSKSKVRENAGFHARDLAQRGFGIDALSDDLIRALTDRHSSDGTVVAVTLALATSKVAPGKAVPALLDAWDNDPGPDGRNLLMYALGEYGVSSCEHRPRIYELMSTHTTWANDRARDALDKSLDDVC